MAERARSGPVGIGVIGAGNISGQYLRNLMSFPDTRVLAVGDAVPAVARAKAAEHGVPVAGDVGAVLDEPDVEIVVNLTIPAAHAEVAEAAFAAGKHVWNEKPIALDRASAGRLLDAAEAAGLRLGCAPDTWLGAALQAGLRCVEEGAIGRPLAGLALFQSPGPESWHPNPAFLFQAGAGPLFDIGPYYLTALVELLGPIAAVAAAGSTAHAQRVVGSGPNAGQRFDVTVPTHVGALLRFASGASAQAVFSFDTPQPRQLLEVTGTDATLELVDPNEFGGDIVVRRGGDEPPETIAVEATATRGIGVLEMARAIREDRPHRATGQLAYHVLDAMIAISEAVETGAFVDVPSRVDRAALLPADWDPNARTVRP
jgi:predicted dehydrogenase